MSRTARIVVPGLPHHITQRGNDRREVFLADDDRLFYLSTLRHCARDHGLALLGYCLMTNHVHLVGVPAQEDSLAKAVGGTHRAYAQRFNAEYGRTGHLWQGRFFSCALDEGACWRALRYVERNPVRAGMVPEAWRHRWSSAAVHCGLQQADAMLELNLAPWREAWSAAEWRGDLIEPDDEQALMALRANTTTGHPVGSDEFIDELERTLGRRCRPLPVGRPRKRLEAGIANTHSP